MPKKAYKFLSTKTDYKSTYIKKKKIFTSYLFNLELKAN